jgi:hypothetical protein
MDSGGFDRTCARCEKHIGFYERFWWHRPDGSIVDWDYIAMRDDDRVQDPASEFYHRDCLGPAEPLAITALRQTTHDTAVNPR